MSIGTSAVSEAPLADAAAIPGTGKTKGPPPKRQMTAIKDAPQTAELR